MQALRPLDALIAEMVAKQPPVVVDARRAPCPRKGGRRRSGISASCCLARPPQGDDRSATRLHRTRRSDAIDATERSTNLAVGFGSETSSHVAKLLPELLRGGIQVRLGLRASITCSRPTPAGAAESRPEAPRSYVGACRSAVSISAPPNPTVGTAARGILPASIEGRFSEV